MWNACCTFFSYCIGTGSQESQQSNAQKIYNCFCDAIENDLQLLAIYYAELLQKQIPNDENALAAKNIAANFLNFCNNNPILRRNKTICSYYVDNVLQDGIVRTWEQLTCPDYPALMA